MADVIVTERSRLVLSWGVFLALLSFVVIAVETRSTVARHTDQLSELKTEITQSATKADIERLEGRIIRIETLLLSQQPRAGR